MTLAARDTAVVLIAHGAASSLDDLPELLTNIRRGRAPPPELLAEVRRRYEAIGGRSPLLDITREVARKLQRRLTLPTRVAMRLFHPYPKDVIAELAREGIRRIVTVPLAQHSGAVYGAAMTAAARAIDPTLEVLCATNWGRAPALTRAFADSVGAALARVPEGAADRTALVFTAHSLPVAVIASGDPYEQDFRGSASDVTAELRARGARFAEGVVAYQSQGIGAQGEWLGPDLAATLEGLAERGREHVVLAPIGFLADHVEILYDLDVEAMSWCAGSRGPAHTGDDDGGALPMVLYRSASLNAADPLIDALEAVTRDVLARPDEHRGAPAVTGATARRGATSGG